GGASVQPPGGEEGPHRQPQPQDGVTELLTPSRLHGVKILGVHLVQIPDVVGSHVSSHDDPLRSSYLVWRLRSRIPDTAGAPQRARAGRRPATPLPAPARPR